MVSLPLLALLFAAFLGCPSPVAQKPATPKDRKEELAEQASQPVALVSSPVKPGPDQGGFSVEDPAYAEDPGP